MLSKLISIAMLLFSTTANATVLLEENFDSVPDWVSAQEESKSCGSGNDAFYFAGTCTTNCPPPLTTTTNWTGAYYASSVYCDDAGNQMYQINSNSPRGGVGKSMEYWAEAWPISANWTGGRIVHRLDTPQTTIYMRMWMKYSSGFVASSDTYSEHGFHKVLSVSSRPHIDPVNESQLFSRDNDSFASPDMIWQNYFNYGYADNQFQINPSPRSGPSYNFDIDINDATYYPVQTIDGEWHCYEVGVTLNSAPGVSDGMYEFWYDGVKTHSNYTAKWVLSVPWSSGHAYTVDHLQYGTVTPVASMKGFRCLTTHTSGGTEPNWSSATNLGDVVSDGNGNQWEYYTDFKWNMIWLLDNIYIGQVGHAEQAVYVDDIVVSTSYIGPDYVIGKSSGRRYPYLSIVGD